MPIRDLSVEDFRLLKIRINDDKTVIDAAVEKKLNNRVFRRLENSTDPAERLEYRKAMEGITLLKDQQVFEAFLRQHLQDYFDDVRDVLSNTNTPAAVERQVKKGVRTYYLDEAYARKKVDEISQTATGGGGGGNQNAPQPVLVSDLHITRKGSTGLFLKWKRPATGCEQVRLVKNSNREPQSPTDGLSEILAGDDQYEDRGLRPGQTRYYALYSVCQGMVSPTAVRRKVMMPKDVEDIKFERQVALNSAVGGDDVEISWKAPALAYRVWVIVKAGGKPTVHINGNQLDTPDGRVIHRDEKSTCLVRGIPSGQTLHFHFVVDLGDGLFSEGITDTLRIADRPQPPTNARAKFDGKNVRVTWTPPSTAVEGYAIFRSETAPIMQVPPQNNLKRFESKVPHFMDTDPPKGQLVYYSVFATQDNTQSVGGAPCDVMTAINPTYVSIECTRSGAMIRWKRPAGAERVDVYRITSGSPQLLPPGGASHHHDADTRSGQRSYRVVAIYKHPNTRQEIQSTGETKTVNYAQPAAPFKQFDVTEASGTFVFTVESAEPTQFGQKFGFIRAPTGWMLSPGDAIPVNQLPPLLLEVNAQDGVRTYRCPSGSHTASLLKFAVFSIHAGLATLVGLAELTNLKPVDPASIRVYDNSPSVQINFAWPDPECTEVLIVWNDSGQTPDPDRLDGYHQNLRSVHREEFQSRSNRIYIRISEPRQQWTLFFFAKYDKGGISKYAPPTQKKEYLGKGYQIYWREVTGDSLFRGKKRTFRCELDHNTRTLVSDLVLVKRQGRRPEAINAPDTVPVDRKGSEVPKRFRSWR